MRDRKGKKVKASVPLIETADDRERVRVWLDHTLASLTRHDLPKLTTNERMVIDTQIDALRAVRKAFCGPDQKPVGDDDDAADQE